MPRPSAATCCSARAAPISTTPPAPATNANPAPAATRATARTACTPCSAGAKHCIATHPSDFCVPLVALDAVVEIEGSAGRREMALEELHLLPGDTPERETVLEPGELIVAVRLPAARRAFAAHARYLKVRERTSYAFAWSRPPPRLRIETATIARHGSRWAASRQALAGPRRGGTADWRPPRPELPPRRRGRAGRARLPATTPSRSSSRADRRARARARRRRNARTRCPPSPPPPSRPSLERSMAEITCPSPCPAGTAPISASP